MKTKVLVEAENALQRAKWIDGFLRKRSKFIDVLKKANVALENYDKTCIHPNLTYKHEGSSGGWDYEGSYWTTWKCDVCEDRWSTDQREGERETKKKFPHAIEISKYG